MPRPKREAAIKANESLKDLAPKARGPRSSKDAKKAKIQPNTDEEPSKVKNTDASKKTESNPDQKVPIKKDEANGSKKPEAKPKAPVANESILKNLIISDHNGKDVNVYELSQENGLVIFSYPKASTPGCSKQVCFFRDAHKEIEQFGYKLFGLSNDKSEPNTKFAKKYDLNYPLLSDHENKLTKVLNISQAGKNVIRSCFVIEKGAVKIHSNIKVGPKDSLDWALKTLKELQ